jgi:hypothetical protein
MSAGAHPPARLSSPPSTPYLSKERLSSPSCAPYEASTWLLRHRANGGSVLSLNSLLYAIKDRNAVAHRSSPLTTNTVREISAAAPIGAPPEAETFHGGEDGMRLSRTAHSIAALAACARRASIGSLPWTVPGSTKVRRETPRL